MDGLDMLCDRRARLNAPLLIPLSIHAPPASRVLNLANLLVRPEAISKQDQSLFFHTLASRNSLCYLWICSPGKKLPSLDPPMSHVHVPRFLRGRGRYHDVHVEHVFSLQNQVFKPEKAIIKRKWWEERGGMG